MKVNNPFNIFITGVGGQGIVTLTKAIWKVCEQNSLQCKGSILKGGAQTLGSVQAIIRIFHSPETNYSYFSSEIPNGELDLLIGLEPWEALRQINLFNPKTKIILNDVIIPFWSERHQKIKIADPLKIFDNLGLHLIKKNYNLLAIDKYGTHQMANMEMILDAINNGFLNLPKESFHKIINELQCCPS